MEKSNEFETTLQEGREYLHDHIQEVHTNLLDFLDTTIKANMPVRDAMEDFISVGIREGLLGTKKGMDIGHILENIGWITKALIYSTIPKDIEWDTFIAQIGDGLQQEADRQHKTVDTPENAVRIVQHMLEHQSGKS